MNILVVGGAGYIGSHMVKMLLDHKHDVTVFDNLSTGHREAVIGGEFIEADLADTGALDRVFAAKKYDGVMHFASFIQVGESVKEPAKYYRNNTVNTLNLLEAMVKHDVKCFIFSSTAAIFGEPQYVPIDEVHRTEPINPYGRTKLMVEKILADFATAYGLRSISLRYFNAAGADPSGQLGESHEPESHLIPLVLRAAAGVADSIKVFGTDYDTPDGTCIRDYIHIVDLCEAHLLAIEKLVAGGDSAAFNLGNGNGFSVKQVIDTARKVTSRPINVVEAPRREGDPANLIADATLAKTVLGWQPKYFDLETIIKHAWGWQQAKRY